jgi:hypothetical protein
VFQKHNRIWIKCAAEELKDTVEVTRKGVVRAADSAGITAAAGALDNDGILATIPRFE